MIEDSLQATKESKCVEFKQLFNPGSLQEWTELIKDIIAIANSGGGVILVGVDNKGHPVESDLSGILRLDPADLTNKVYRYTGIQFSDFEIRECKKKSRIVAAIIIGASPSPVVFIKPGTYPVENGNQERAFSQGTVYFRHGAKSEPGTTSDLSAAIDKKLKEVRKDWLSGIRKISKAPAGSVISVLPPQVRISNSPNSTPIRIVDDPSVPAYRQIDPNATHVFRQIDVLKEVKKELPEEQKFNTFDVLAIRRVHDIDSIAKYLFKPIFSSPQYSKEFIMWIIEQYKKDKQFFKKTRARYRGDQWNRT